MTRGQLRSRFAAVALALVVRAACAGPAEYSISPLRIELDRAAQSGMVTLGNTGDDTIDFQISVMEWTQDAEARDNYAPTSDVVFFPKILTLKPGENRVIRVGVQSLPPAKERTYRLFVEPIPKRSHEPVPPGANVAINLRFALPVFVKPAVAHAAGDIEDFSLRAGTLRLAVRNTGNEHLRFDEGATVVGRDAQGREIVSHRIEGLRYVLAGSTKPLSYTVPKDVCARLATIDVSAHAAQLSLSQTLGANRASCE